MFIRQRIIPSIIAKDQKELNHYLRHLKNIVKLIHLDVIDGKFAPNHSLDFKFKLSENYNYNAHLMIKNPEIWIKKYISKINLFIPHFEEIKDVQKYIYFMKENNKEIAFAILPETKVSQLKPYFNEINYVLLLTVHPGFYGGKYIPKELKKIKQIKKLNSKIKIIVDGGMNPITIKEASKLGADYFISGSYTTKADYPKKAIKKLEKEIKK